MAGSTAEPRRPTVTEIEQGYPMTPKQYPTGSRGRKTLLLWMAALAFAVGCAGTHKPIRIDTRVQYRVTIDPRHCRTNTDGTIDCEKGCRLNPLEIRAK